MKGRKISSRMNEIKKVRTFLHGNPKTFVASPALFNLRCFFKNIEQILAIEQTFVGQGCSLDRLTTEISKGYKLKKRLEEDDRLQMLYEGTRRFYDLF
jgi:hypothetical protein